MRFLIILTVTCILVACDDESDLITNACTAEDPIEEVAWLGELKNSLTNCMCEFSIIQGEYLGETVFYVAGTDPRCNYIYEPTLYNCSGTIIKEFGSTEKDRDELKNLIFEQVLYRCND